MILSPEGRCVAYPVEVQFFFYIYIICLSNRVLHFHKSIKFLKIFEPRKCFIPRREIRSISSRGPIDTLSIYCLRERILHFQKSIGFLMIFEPRKCFPRREIRSIFSGGPNVFTCDLFYNRKSLEHFKIL